MLRNRDDPIGYKLSVISFDSTTGTPEAQANSTSSYTDIVSNPDLSKCPDGCFRPVGLAWDSEGRLFMSSDSTGEIYVVTRTDGSSADSSDGAVEGASSGEPPSPGSTESTATRGVALGGFAVPWAIILGAYLVS